MPADTKASIKKFIADSFLYREGIDELGDGDSLLENGVIDSTGILELVAFLEKTFNIRVADDEVVPENLDSVNQLLDYVNRKQGKPAGVGGANAR